MRRPKAGIIKIELMLNLEKKILEYRDIGYSDDDIRSYSYLDKISQLLPC